jgi:membrane protease YdiL (CAAX protease family)
LNRHNVFKKNALAQRLTACYFRMMKRKNFLLFTAFALGPVYFAARIIFFGGHFYFDQSKILLFLVAAPAAEELFFRGVVQEWLLRKTKGAFFGLGYANIAASVLFSLFHLAGNPPLHSFLVFFPSLVFGVIYRESRSVPLCILCHSLYNLNVMIL